MYPPSLGLISWAVCQKYAETLPSRQIGVQEMARMQLSMINIQSNEYLCGSHESVMTDRPMDEHLNEWTDRPISAACLLTASSSNSIVGVDYTPGRSFYPLRKPAAHGSTYMYITVTITYMTSNIFVVASSGYISLPNYHQIIARKNVGLSVEPI